MASNDTLFTTLSINSIDVNDGKEHKLFPRELAITSTGELCVGDPTVTAQTPTNIKGITVSKAKSLEWLSSDSESSVEINDDGAVFKGITLESATLTGRLSLGSASDRYINIIKSADGTERPVLSLKSGIVRYGTFDYSTLNTPTIKDAVLNLSKVSYGTELPTGTSYVIEEKDLDGNITQVTKPINEGDIFILVG